MTWIEKNWLCWFKDHCGMTISSLYLLLPIRADQTVIKAASEIRYDTKFGMCPYKENKKNFNKT